jgi:hypothetical protein
VVVGGHACPGDGDGGHRVMGTLSRKKKSRNAASVWQ